MIFALQAETPRKAAQEAGEHRREVYMGIDVYGRGTYAGGQMNSYVAAAAALREGGSDDALSGGWRLKEAPPEYILVYDGAALTPWPCLAGSARLPSPCCTNSAHPALCSQGKASAIPMT